MDWNFVVELYLQDLGVSYVLSPVDLIHRPASWIKDNVAVCLLITQTVDPSNYQYIQDFRNNAVAMWAGLKAAHQDFSSGERIYTGYASLSRQG